MNVTVKVENLDKLISALRKNGNLANEFVNLWDAIGLDLSSKAKEGAPVDTGLLRSRITYERDRSPFPTWVKVGTMGAQVPNYAAWMEYGTGLLNDHPSWPKKRVKMPPVAALTPWASRKGRSRYARPGANAEDVAGDVAWAIWKRGGLRPRRYIRNPFEEYKSKYERWIKETIERVNLG